MADINHLYAVTHTDLDGIGSAATLLRVYGRRPGRDATVAFTEPYELHEVLRGLGEYVERGDLLAITDLGLNEDTRGPVLDAIKSIVSRGARVEWYDHHVWSEADAASLSRLGVEIYVDRTTCATGVVARYAAGGRGSADTFLGELVDAVCSADLWRWTNSLSAKLFRAAGSREAGNEWRVKVLEKFLDGILWDEELERRLEEYVNAELANMREILKTVYTLEAGRARIAVAYKENGPPANSIVGALLTSRYKADIAAIVRPNGVISLRSRKVNVQRIAVKLGGGGHPRAAGAKIRIPLLVRLLGRLTPKIITLYTAIIVARAASNNLELLQDEPETPY